MPDGDERQPETEEKADSSDGDGADIGPKQRLEDASGEISRAGDDATDATDELKKDVRTKVDDAKENS